jgi:hypothetical protein
VRPIQFVKAHPLGFILSAATGMIVGPWALRMLNNATGVGVSLPSVNGG